MIGAAMDPPVPIEVAVVAFLEEHRRCGELEAASKRGVH
jgi:hypothetical protein